MFVCSLHYENSVFFMDVNTQTKAVISWACVAVWFDLTFLKGGKRGVGVGVGDQHRMQNLQFWDSLLKIKFYLYTLIYHK